MFDLTISLFLLIILNLVYFYVNKKNSIVELFELFGANDFIFNLMILRQDL